MAGRLRHTERLRLALATALLAFAWAPEAVARPARIGVVSDAEWVSDSLDETVRTEIRALLEGEFEVAFPDEAQVRTEGDLARANEGLERLFAASDVDVIVAIGPIATQALAGRQLFPKPTIGTLAFDPVLQSLPLTAQGTSGRRNLTYSLSQAPLPDLVREFETLAELDAVVLLGDPALLSQIPELRGTVTRLSAETGVDISIVDWTRPLAASVDALPPGIDGVLVGPLRSLEDAEIEDLALRLRERRLPSVAIGGTREVELGLLATFATPRGDARLARRVALRVQTALLGGDLGVLPVARASRLELVLNVETARKVGVFPRYDVLSRASLLYADPAYGSDVSTLEGVIDESLRRNLDLLSQDRIVAAGREDVFLALSALLPQADLKASYSVIDGDRASGAFPEREARIGVSADQVLFDEFLFANYGISKHVQGSLEAARETVRQDVIQATGIAYVQVLQAATAARIERDNLRVTRENLALAETRRRVGTAAASEVFRWESEEATANRALVDAEADLATTRFELNQVLDRPVEERAGLRDLGLEDVGYALVDPRVRGYLERPSGLQRLRDYLVARGVERAPELAGLDREIAAQERLLSSRRRAFYLPTLGAQASVDRVDAGGDGASDRVGNDTEWSVGVELSFPLSSGGGRIAELRQAREDLSGLRIERRSERLAVETRIRSAANAASASLIGIELSQRAAASAQRNLEIVTEQYARGAIEILDLLDAQNTTFTAQQDAAAAVYEHLIDLLELQRAGGRFEFFLPPDRRDEEIEALRAYLERGDVP